MSVCLCGVVVVVVVVTIVVTCSCFYRASIVGKEVLPPPELERIFGLTGGRDFCIEQHFPSPNTYLVSSVLLLSMSFPPMFLSDLSSSMPVTITMCSPFYKPYHINNSVEKLQDS